MKKDCFYLSLLCRSRGSLRRPDCKHIDLPVRYAWQENPNDLHIQLATPEQWNICPEMDEESGDYLIPSSPWLLKHLGRSYEPDLVTKYKWPEGKVSSAIRVYSFEWKPAPTGNDGSAVAPLTYLKHLEKHWYSPNR